MKNIFIKTETIVTAEVSPDHTKITKRLDAWVKIQGDSNINQIVDTSENNITLLSLQYDNGMIEQIFCSSEDFIKKLESVGYEFI